MSSLPAPWSCLLLLLLPLGWQPAAACNPNPPRPPILEGYSYDAMAAGYLLRDSSSVVAARLETVLELDFEADEDGPDATRKSYVFEVLEGWQAVTPRRLTIDGYWVDCDIEPRPGRVFLLYLDGARLLYAVPVERLDFELTLLGEPGWFYDARGRLVQEPEA
ncbi:MAG: hypothetical protein ACNA8J_10330 [Gammaproteobacteria bacterium]